MKILIATPNLYKEGYPEFTKDKTGFGLMVYDIFESVSGKAETRLISNKFTEGHPDDGILRHGPWDVVRHVRARDVADGIHDFAAYNQSLKGRLKYLYFKLNKGYIRQAIRKFQPDIVHIHGIGFPSLSYIEVCREMGIPFLVTLHGLFGLDASTKASKENRMLEREFIANLSSNGEFATIVSSGSKRRALENYSSSASEYIEVIFNGTNAIEGLHESQALASSPGSFLPAHFSNDGIYKFIVVGNICEHRNQIQILEALKRKNELTAQKSVVVFCGNDTSNGEFQSRIEEMGLSESVFCTGFVSKETVYGLYEWANCNIVASREEGFGLSIIEAAAFGVPTVAFSDLDAIDDLYSPCSMVRVEERSTEALADGLNVAMSNDWDPEAICKHAARFSLDAMAEKYIESYGKVISKQLTIE